MCLQGKQTNVLEGRVSYKRRSVVLPVNQWSPYPFAVWPCHVAKSRETDNRRRFKHRMFIVLADALQEHSFPGKQSTCLIKNACMLGRH